MFQYIIHKSLCCCGSVFRFAGFWIWNFLTIYQLDLPRQLLSSPTVPLKTPWNREIDAAAKQYHSLPRVGLCRELDPHHDKTCHPYYCISNNNDDNITLDHCITAEYLGGRRNDCTLVVWLPWFGPKARGEDAWKTRIPPHHSCDIWAVHWQRLSHSNAAPYGNLSAFTTRWPHVITSVPGTSLISVTAKSQCQLPGNNSPQLYQCSLSSSRSVLVRNIASAKGFFHYELWFQGRWFTNEDGKI